MKSLACPTCNHDYRRDDRDEDGHISIPVIATCADPGCGKTHCAACHTFQCSACDLTYCVSHRIRYQDGEWCTACVLMECDAARAEYSEMVAHG